MTPPLLGAVPLPLPRSRFITVIGWIVAAASVLALPFSVISFMMVLVGSEGTAHMDPLDGLIVIAGPPATLLAGIGLVRRWRWAWVYLLVVLAGFVARSVNEIIEGPTQEQIYTSADGVRHTISATEVNYPFHVFVIAVGTGLFVFLLSRNARREFRIGGRQQLASGNATAVGAPVISVLNPRAETASPDSSGRSDLKSPAAQGALADAASGWRVGHQGRDCMYYEENHGGTWHRLEISGEMLMGRAHHVIYFASPQAWQSYPEWARQRRDEIIARIASQFRPPDYEYGNDAPPAPATAAVAGAGFQNVSGPRIQIPGGASPRVSRPAVTNPVQRKQSLALLVAIVGLLAIAGVMFWIVQSGMKNGETALPSKRPSQRRIVSRVDEPAFFWVSMGLYTTLGSGSLGLAVWGIRFALKERQAVGGNG